MKIKSEPDSLNNVAEGDEDEHFFFIHIQKTAGVSLRQHLLANFKREQIYPPLPTGKNAMKDFLTLYLSGAFLVSLPASEHSKYKLFHGHMPFTVTKRLTFKAPLKTFTILRDPIERTLSVLLQKKRQRQEYTDATLEEIYADPRIFEGEILNHQTKIFAVPNNSDLLGGYAPYAVDKSGLEVAKRNLKSIDVIGLQSNMPAFLEDLACKFGWTMLEDDVRKNVGSKPNVSQAFLNRIAADNRIEIDFYRYAVDLVAARSALK